MTALRTMPLKNMRDKSALLVHEIFLSIQGESSFAGLPCVFVRTTACHLRCSYCDTEHAFYAGSEMTLEEITDKVKNFGIPLVEITGGEPLLQKSTFTLMQTLCDLGFMVLLETSGGVSIDKVDRRVHVILDVKTPGSGEHERNVWSNFELIWPGCEIKFVICDREDYLFAKNILQKFDLAMRCHVLFSHEAKTMNATKLAEWIIEDRLPVRFQTQLHKFLWGDKTGV